MSSLALLFVGAVLLVNGLVLLGRVDARAAVPINLITGAGLVTASLIIAIPAGGSDRLELFGAVGYGLFGVTYLTVAGGTLLRADGRALGWYCAWASATAVVLAAINLTSGDARMAWLWSAWAVLFFVFFLSGCAVAPRWDVAAGVLAIYQSVTTATVPSLLMIDGAWNTVPLGWIAAAQMAGVVLAAAVAVRAPVPGRVRLATA